MSKTFAIADLHGRFDLLEMAIDRIEQSSHSGGTIVFLGDYVDRGPQSRQIIERLMAGPTDPRWKWVCLKGNHEAMAVQVCVTGALVHWWMQNGGGSTLISFGNPANEIADVSRVPQEVLRWLNGLPLTYVDEHRVFVHAGVDPFTPLDKQDEEQLIWKLYADDDERGHGTRHVVHGHHQFEDGPIYLTGRTDLDTFAWYTGRLVVGVFDDDVPGGPVTSIEVLGKHIQEIRRAA